MFKPLLSATYESRFPPRYPVLASPKLDGIRIIIIDGVPMTRSLKKPVPSKVVRGALEGLPWFDGEILAGEPNSEAACANTQSKVMSAEGMTLEDEWTFHIFDIADPSYHGMSFQERFDGMRRSVEAVRNKYFRLAPHLSVLDHAVINNDEELWAYEDQCVKLGYEGIMIRDPLGVYKCGRSTAKERILTKIKRWEDTEGIITETHEEMHNGNEPKINALGRVERSSHQENKTGTGRLGGYTVKTKRHLHDNLFSLEGDDPECPWVYFYLGATANVKQADRVKMWEERDKFTDGVVTFKYQPTKGAERPRFSVYKVVRLDV